MANEIDAPTSGPSSSNDDRSETGRAEWDARYTEHDAMWSGQPNGSLVAEAAELTPGRALDLGCGEGADAVWLARRGWQVTATDISQVAVERGQEAAQAQGIDIDFSATDAIADPPAPGTYDLVLLAYPALRRDIGLAAVPAIADSLTVGGRLLVVGHVHDAEAIKHAAGSGFDPSDYVSIDDVLAIIGSGLASGLVVDVDAERERPNSPEGAHHSRDRVLVVRRSR